MVKSTTVNYIRTQSRKGKSANQIQRGLGVKGIGIRRTTILAYVRQFKGRKPKAESYKYTPRKYLTKDRRIHIEHDVKQKQIAIYGKVKGINRRYEVTGTGHELWDFLSDAVLHPPKKRIARARANRISDRREIDYGKEWDKRPTITS